MNRWETLLRRLNRSIVIAGPHWLELFHATNIFLQFRGCAGCNGRDMSCYQPLRQLDYGSSGRCSADAPSVPTPEGLRATRMPTTDVRDDGATCSGPPTGKTPRRLSNCRHGTRSPSHCQKSSDPRRRSPHSHRTNHTSTQKNCLRLSS